MHNILILGGAGFIGTHLVKRLLSTDNNVTIIDNLKTSNLNFTDDEFVFLYADICSIDDTELLRIFENHDVIYNLAGSVGVDNIEKYPTETLLNNINLANKLIPLFEVAQKHVVFSSTSEIYGSSKIPFSETDVAMIPSPPDQRGGYAASKLLTEFMVTSHSFPSTVVRFFNVVGPGQLPDYGMVLPRFIDAAKNDDPLIIYGTGEQVRCFCHVDDAVTALTMMPEYPGQIFNIGNDVPITMTELAELVIKISGSSSKIEYHTPRVNEIQDRTPNIDKLRGKDFTPKYNLNNIIEDML
jgi:UDP-glucose 4-epimerase